MPRKPINVSRGSGSIIPNNCTLNCRTIRADSLLCLIHAFSKNESMNITDNPSLFSYLLSSQRSLPDLHPTSIFRDKFTKAVKTTLITMKNADELPSGPPGPSRPAARTNGTSPVRRMTVLSSPRTHTKYRCPKCRRQESSSTRCTYRPKQTNDSRGRMMARRTGFPLSMAQRAFTTIPKTSLALRCHSKHLDFAFHREQGPRIPILVGELIAKRFTALSTPRFNCRRLATARLPLDDNSNRLLQRRACVKRQTRPGSRQISCKTGLWEGHRLFFQGR